MIEFVKNFWCQKVLPLVYTDALSYYEMLGKFVGKLNEVIGNVNNLNENTVFSVNNVKPVDGNVNVGTVKSVNGSMPDASGNVNLPQVSGVTSVDGVGADASGNVPLNAVKSVNGITPTDGNVNVGTVKSVNNKTPNSAGNVDVGTVKTINTISPDASGNMSLTADSVNAIAKTAGSVNTNLIADKAVTRNKVADEIVYMPETAYDTTSAVYITKAFGGLFNWIYGTGNNLELDNAEFGRLDTFWEAILYNAETTNLTIKFTNLPDVIDTRTGNKLGGTSQIILEKYKTVKLKKISNTAILVLPA